MNRIETSRVYQCPSHSIEWKSLASIVHDDNATINIVIAGAAPLFGSSQPAHSQ